MIDTNDQYGFIKFLYTEDLFLFDDVSTLHGSKDATGEITDEEVPLAQEEEVVAEEVKIIDKTAFVVQAESLPASLNELLNKIIGAVKLSEERYEIIFNADADISPLSYPHQRQVVFLSADNDIPMARYEIMLMEGRKVIFSDMLDEIASDVQKKKQLWAGLQQMLLSIGS